MDYGQVCVSSEHISEVELSSSAFTSGFVAFLSCGKKALEETFTEVLAAYQCFRPDVWHCLLVCCWFLLHTKPCQWSLCTGLAAAIPVHVHELLCISPGSDTPPRCSLMCSWARFLWGGPLVFYWDQKMLDYSMLDMKDSDLAVICQDLEDGKGKSI